MGAAEALILLVGLGLALATFGFGIWAVVDAARRPEAQWVAAGQSKTLWLLIIIGVTVLGCGTCSWLGALLYALIARPALVRAAA